MFELVDSFITSWLRAQEAKEEVVLFNPVPALRSVAQWNFFITELEKAMSYCEEASFKEAVCQDNSQKDFRRLP